MTPQILIINGPNLNLLGVRQPDVYGHETLADITKICTSLAKEKEMTLTQVQSNSEGEIIDAIHKARDTYAGIIINAGAYSHTSLAIMDALNAYDGAVIEVHISNIHKREPFRHHSHLSARADGVIVGCGVQGYELAIYRLAALLV